MDDGNGTRVAEVVARTWRRGAVRSIATEAIGSRADAIAIDCGGITARSPPRRFMDAVLTIVGALF